MVNPERPFGDSSGWLVVSSIILLLWSGIGFNLWNEHRVDEREAVVDASNLARAFDENIMRTVEAIDQTLRFAREAYERDRAGFNATTWMREHLFLRGLEVQTSIVDRNGNVIWSTFGPTGAVNIADREHFRAQAASQVDALVISKPVLGRVSNRKSIQFVRKLLAVDGAFDGIVTISVDPDYLSRFYRSVDIGRGAIVLANTDGIVLAHAPGTDLTIGQSLSPEGKAQVLGGARSGIGHIVSSLDGVERIISFRRLERYPLVLVVGLAVDDIFVAYRRNLRLYLIVGGLLSGAIIGTAWIMGRQRRSLRDLRREHAFTLANMSQGIIMIRADGSVPLINQRAIDLLGLPPSLMARCKNFQDIVDWQVANNEFIGSELKSPGIFRSLKENGITNGTYVYERARPNGMVLEIRTHILPNRVAVRTYTDITERKRQEQALAEAQVRAGQAERMQALGQLAGGIAHDFNNILQVIQGSASLVDRRSNDPAGAKRLAQMILDATARGSSITRRLLVFARRGELKAEAVDVGPLLNGLCDVLSRTLGSSIKVHIALNDDRLQLLVDKGQFETVLVNLATNARDAMPQGGTLTFTVTAETVVKTTPLAVDLQPGRYVHLAVSDTGSGMDKATLARVLEPFFTTKPIDKGTGLGLPMAKGFAEQSGGGIKIESIPDRGTTVHLWMPALVSSLPAPQWDLTTRRFDQQARKRILLVDDESAVRDTMAELLEDAGFSVLIATSGPEALDQLTSGAMVDLLITDLSMPEMDGLTIIQETHCRYPDLPVILLTGYAGDGAQLAVSGSIGGAFVLMRKPVTVTQLIDQIEALLAVAMPLVEPLN